MSQWLRGRCRRQHNHSATLQHTAECEDIPHIIIDHPDFLPTRASSERCRRSSIFCFSAGRFPITRCRNRAVSSSSRSGDSTPLTTTLRASVCSRHLPPEKVLARKDDHRQVAQRGIIAEAFQDLEAATYRASEDRARRNRRFRDAHLEGILPVSTDDRNVNIVIAQQL